MAPVASLIGLESGKIGSIRPPSIARHTGEA